MKHLFSGRVRTVLILAVVLAVLLTVVSSLTGLQLPEMLVQGILAPIRSGVSKLTDNAQQLYSYIFEYEALLEENKSLKEQLSQMEDEARQADSIARENQRLRDLLELKQLREDFKLVDGYIISRSSNDWSDTFTINRGTTSGIQAGMCAITATGEMVGLVSQAGPNYAVIKSVLDSSTKINATISVSGYNGTVQGGYATRANGLLRMDYLPNDAMILNNSQVVTTGSVVYPKNLTLGYVVGAGFDDTGVSMYALLKPAVEISRLEQVFIVTEFDAG